MGLSVSRVGGHAQIKAMRQVAGRLRIDLAQFNELATFAKFGSELDSHSQALLSRGERMRELLKQDTLHPLPVEQQVIIIHAGVNGFLDDMPIDEIREWESEYLSFMQKNYPSITDKIRESGAMDEQLRNDLTEAIKTFKAR